MEPSDGGARWRGLTPPAPGQTIESHFLLAPLTQFSYLCAISFRRPELRLLKPVALSGNQIGKSNECYGVDGL